MKLRGYYRKLRFIKESRAPHSVTENSGKKKTFNFDPYLSYPCYYKHQHVRSFHYLSLNMKDIQFYNLHQGTFWGVFGELCFKDLFFFLCCSLFFGRREVSSNAQCLCSLCSTFSLLQTSTCSIIPADLSAEGKSDAFCRYWSHWIFQKLQGNKCQCEHIAWPWRNPWITVAKPN